MTLREARVLFTRLKCELILWAFERGYEVASGEGMERLTEKDPTSDHMQGSLHHVGLAEDLDLYRDGKWLDKTEDHRELGEKWKSMHKYCRWGGDFSKPDGCHYSLAPPDLVGKRA